MAKNTDEIVPAEYLEKSLLENFPTTPDEIRKYIESIGLTAEDTVFRASEYDLTDKNDLVGAPLFIVQWRERVSAEYGTPYVIVHAIRTDTGEKVVFVDGGTGISESLMSETVKREEKGLSGLALRSALSVPKGLTRSDYDAHTSPTTGEMIPGGTTYYLG